MFPSVRISRKGNGVLEHDNSEKGQGNQDELEPGEHEEANSRKVYASGVAAFERVVLDVAVDVQKEDEEYGEQDCVGLQSAFFLVCCHTLGSSRAGCGSPR